MTTGGDRHWVLIETGANQGYIFDTNRLRHVVGGSYLVDQVGTAWAPEAASTHGAQVVLRVSGKALLLTDDPDAGRSVVSAVSARALAQAPGLEVTGVVGPAFDPTLSWKPDSGGSGPLTHVEALDQTYEWLEEARSGRPSPLLRDPMLPWFEVCRDSGLPVAGVEQQTEKTLVSAGVLAKSDARHRARDRMRDLFLDLPDVVPPGGDELRDDGWVAVIHADGNGIGRIFTNFPERALQAVRESGGGADGLTLDDHTRLLSDFTEQLRLVTETALGLAVRDTVQGRKRTDNSVLPVVFGGDDVTVICDARFALGIARRFLLAFEKLASDEQAPRLGALRAIAQQRLTGAAGIAYVKPHHPFSAAYALAEELTASAKTAKQAGDAEVSALDLHVAFESTLADLTTLRSRMAIGGFPRHGGPYVVTTDGGPAAGPRSIDALDDAMATLSQVSSSLAHDLRDGLAQGRAEFQRRLRLAAMSSDRPDGVSREDIERLAPVNVEADDGPAAGVPIVRLLDALLLNSIGKGSASPDEQVAGDVVTAGAGR